MCTMNLIASTWRGMSNEAAAPKVSVIVPAFNAALFLERALNSVLTQTMPDFEIIVVDDGSSDATLEIARKAAACDSRIRVLQNERNLGLSMSRNRAIGVARGEWVAFLDADDLWSSERLAQMLAVANEADVVSDDINIYIPHNSEITCAWGEIWSLLLHQSVDVTKCPRQVNILEFVRHDLGLLKPLIRRSFLEQHSLVHKSHLRIVPDFSLYFEILASGARWLQLPNRFYYYYRHPSSLSNANMRQMCQEIIAADKILLKHPAALENARLADALKRHIHEFQGWVYILSIKDLLRRGLIVQFVRL